MPKSWMFVAGFIVLAVAFGALGVYYWTSDTDLFASAMGRHHKHAAICFGLAVLLLVGASFSRPRASIA
jgi:branched-subunit amino acid permease